MRDISFTPILAACAAVLLSFYSSDGFAKPKLVSLHGDWGVFATEPSASRTCYSLSQSKQREPSNLTRPPAFIYISHRPANQVHNEVSIIMGFEVKSGSAATAEVGSQKFPLVSKDKIVWLRYQTDEPRFVEALASGRNLVIRAYTLANIQNVDTFSLMGVRNALSQAARECRVSPSSPSISLEATWRSECSRMGFQPDTIEMANCTLRLRELHSKLEEHKRAQEQHKLMLEEARREREVDANLRLLQLGLGMAAGGRVSGGATGSRALPILPPPPPPLTIIAPSGNRYNCSSFGATIACR